MIILHKKNIILLFICCLALPFHGAGQIQIQSAAPIEGMVESIVGELHYENVTYQGYHLTRAMFQNGNTTNLGIDKGIILCSGDPYYIPGPNNDCMGFIMWGTPGHPLLDAISTSPTTTEAAVLEFDVIPEENEIMFTYVFGSEGYNDNIVTIFHSDVFGCFITGPDPSGGDYTDQNIALIPGTDITIQTSTINNGTAPCGLAPTGPCENCGYFWDNTGGATLEYDGFTVIFEASIEVIPCETYHVVLGVANGLMGVRDAAVFIEESDYKSPRLDISVEPAVSDTLYTIMEGCGGIDIIIKLPDQEFAPVTLDLDWSQGIADPSAWPAGDFEENLPQEITFEAGEDSLAIHIAAVDDGLAEGDELLRLIVGYTLTCSMKYDTVDIVVQDYEGMSIQTSNDTVICQGDTALLWVKVMNGAPSFGYHWQGLPFSDDSLLISPEVSNWYHVDVFDQCSDTITDSIHVTVIPAPVVDLGPDTSFCTGEEITLQSYSAGSGTYLWSTGATTASITVSEPGVYSLTQTSLCGSASDEITVEEWPVPEINLGPDLQLCYGQSVFLEAPPGYVNYLWQDNSTEDFYTVTQSGLYTLQVEDIHGCTGMDSLLAFVGNIVNWQEDTLALCEGASVTLEAGSGFNTYEWSTGQMGVPSIQVNEPGWYSVFVSYDFGCPSADSAFVEDTPIPVAEITGQDIVCEGDSIWLQAPEGKYDYYWNGEYGSTSYMVTSAGNYTLTLVNACGEDEDSKFIQYSLLPLVDLGPDQLLFPGESATLDAGDFQSFVWNNDPGLNGRYFEVVYEDINGKDSIWVEVFDGFCKNTDDIILEVYNVTVPNVITPNGDGLNDTFTPMEVWNGVNRNHIRVMNRWGEQVWESDDFLSGWDGKHNGRLVSAGTYFWVLEVWYGQENLQKVYKGTLTVLVDGS